MLRLAWLVSALSALVKTAYDIGFREKEKANDLALSFSSTSVLVQDEDFEQRHRGPHEGADDDNVPNLDQHYSAFQ